jgi:predicted nucleic acid-binding protein
VVFADTNIVVYAYGVDPAKVAAAKTIWDALIIAAALATGCDTLYSEDLQNGQIFEERLTVKNPFAGP